LVKICKTQSHKDAMAREFFPIPLQLFTNKDFMK
jgi:hypothetical protein